MDCHRWYPGNLPRNFLSPSTWTTPYGTNNVAVVRDTRRIYGGTDVTQRPGSIPGGYVHHAVAGAGEAHFVSPDPSTALTIGVIIPAGQDYHILLDTPTA